MITLNIPIEECGVLLDEPMDLGSLASEEIVRQITAAYAFLPVPVEVTLSEGILQITVSVETQPDARAQQLYYRAIQHAERGKYKQAIDLLHEVIRSVPGYGEAQRNLGMAYLELGNTAKAKTHILYALRLNPHDVWSYTLMGNLYSKYENKPHRALVFYRRALTINPEDPYLLTSLAATLIKVGRADEAHPLFERVVERHPSYPNAHLGLALLYQDQGQPELSLTALEKLFHQPPSSDPRHQPVYAEARRLYGQLQEHLAKTSHGILMDIVKIRVLALEESLGTPITLVPDNSLEYVLAVSEAAWRHGRGNHVIRYRDTIPAITPHLIAHELEHLRLESQARAANRYRQFATTPKTREQAIRSIASHVQHLQRLGFPDSEIQNVTLQFVDGLARQLFNCPLDMLVEHRLYHDLEALRPSQFVSLRKVHQDAALIVTNPEIRKLSPPSIWRASVALNHAYALFTDQLFSGATEYARVYHDTGTLNIAQKLLQAWHTMMTSYRPGDEYTLVDEFAQILGLRGWYDWQPVALSEGGPTNPQLLAAKHPAAVMYCLGALQRFQGMPKDEIFRIGAEIALLGRTGIDYASAEPKYTLHSLPGEKFTGLQLLCLMYVAFQQVQPGLNLQLDLKDAYTQALQIFQAHQSS